MDVKNIDNNTTEVKSCACRFAKEDNRIGECEYLCPIHQEEFILSLYNSQSIQRTSSANE